MNVEIGTARKDVRRAVEEEGVRNAHAADREYVAVARIMSFL